MNGFYFSRFLLIIVRQSLIIVNIGISIKNGLTVLPNAQDQCLKIIGTIFHLFRYRLDLSKLATLNSTFQFHTYNIFARIGYDASFTCKIPVVFNNNKMEHYTILNYAKLFTGDEIRNYVTYYKWGSEVDPEDIQIKKDGTQVSKSNINVPDVV